MQEPDEPANQEALPAGEQSEPQVQSAPLARNSEEDVHRCIACKVPPAVRSSSHMRCSAMQVIQRPGSGHHGSSGDSGSGESSGDEPKRDALFWPARPRSASWLVGEATCMMERYGGETGLSMTTLMAGELLTARTAHFERMEGALGNLLSKSHEDADDISKAKEYIKETGAAFKLAQLQVEEALSWVP